MNRYEEEKSNCAGQMHGHNFPYAGSNCLGCGVSQHDLSGSRPSKPEVTRSISGLVDRFQIKKRNPRIHSGLHALVSESRSLFGEDAKTGKGSFGFYLGFFKRLGEDRVRIFLADAKESRDPKRKFWWLVGKYYREKREKKARENGISLDNQV